MDTAEGTMSMAVAAWLTTAAVRGLMQRFDNCAFFTKTLGIESYEEFFEMLGSFRKSGLAKAAKDSAKDARISANVGVEEASQALRACRPRAPKRKWLRSNVCVRPEKQFAAANHRELMDSLLRSVERLIYTDVVCEKSFVVVSNFGAITPSRPELLETCIPCLCFSI